MFEILLALLIVALLIASAALPPATLVWGGVALALLGAGVGVPAGLVYHAQLWRALRRENIPTRGMWLNPMRLHERLSEGEQARIRVVFWVGAAGFLVCVIGAVGVFVGVVRIMVS